MRSFVNKLLIILIVLFNTVQTETQENCNFPQKPGGQLFCEKDQLASCYTENGQYIGKCKNRITLSGNKVSVYILSIAKGKTISLDINSYTKTEKEEYSTILQQLLMSTDSNGVSSITIEGNKYTFGLPGWAREQLGETITALNNINIIPSPTIKRFNRSDTVKALNVVLGLEYEAISAYNAGANLLDTSTLMLAKRFIADHEEHRNALIATIRKSGGTPIDEPKFDIAKTLKKVGLGTLTGNNFFQLAITLERQAALAYLTVIPKLEEKEITEILKRIANEETAHANKLETIPDYFLDDAPNKNNGS